MALKERARWNRRWLRERPEHHIVVVSHGDCLRYITGDVNTHEPWANTEVREYTFEVDEDEDEHGEAWLKPLKTIAKMGRREATSSEL